MRRAVRRSFTDEPSIEELVRESAQKLAEQKIEWLRAQPGIAETQKRIKARWTERERLNAERRADHDAALLEDAERSTVGPKRVRPAVLPIRKGER